MFNQLKYWAKQLKQTVYALYLASTAGDVPWYAKLLIGAVVAYALSPIDLIPDFIPVIGYLDDLLLLPVGIWLAIKLIPNDVWQRCLKQAEQRQSLPKNKKAAWVVIAIWLVCFFILLRWFFNLP